MNDVNRMLLAKKKINEYCKTCKNNCGVAKALRGLHEILRNGNLLELKVCVQGKQVGIIYTDDSFLLGDFCDHYKERETS